MAYFQHYARGKRFAKEAVQLDQKHEYKNALNMYVQAAAELVASSKLDYDKSRKNACETAASRYVKRAEMLKEYLIERGEHLKEFVSKRKESDGADGDEAGKTTTTPGGGNDNRRVESFPGSKSTHGDEDATKKINLTNTGISSSSSPSPSHSSLSIPYDVCHPEEGEEGNAAQLSEKKRQLRTLLQKLRPSLHGNEHAGRFDKTKRIGDPVNDGGKTTPSSRKFSSSKNTTTNTTSKRVDAPPPYVENTTPSASWGSSRSRERLNKYNNNLSTSRNNHSVVVPTSSSAEESPTPAYVTPARGTSTSDLPRDWEEYTDPSTGSPYYHNRATGVTTWERPSSSSKSTSSVAKSLPSSKLSDMKMSFSSSSSPLPGVSPAVVSRHAISSHRTLRVIVIFAEKKETLTCSATDTLATVISKSKTKLVIEEEGEVGDAVESSFSIFCPSVGFVKPTFILANVELGHPFVVDSDTSPCDVVVGLVPKTRAGKMLCSDLDSIASDAKAVWEESKRGARKSTVLQERITQLLLRLDSVVTTQTTRPLRRMQVRHLLSLSRSLSASKV